MRKQDYWRLTVSFWPRAAAARVEPTVMVGFPHDHDTNRAYYRPHDIDFDHPPSRADFLEVVQQRPWMSVWQEDLLPLIERNDWPMIDYAHKGANVDLMDEGRKVGELKVLRQECFMNTPYQTPFIGLDNINHALRGVRDREAAKQVIRARENRIQEMVTNGGEVTEDALVRAIHAVLHEAGLRKAKARLPAVA